MGRQNSPACIITFDDGKESTYLNGLQYLTSKGLKGTLYVITDNVGVHGADEPNQYVTLSELQTAQTNGHLIANHTTNHVNLDTEGLTLEDQLSEIGGAQTWLNNNGFDGADHLAYPHGRAVDITIQACEDLGIKTGVTTNSGTTPPQVQDFYDLNRYLYTQTESISTYLSYLDNAIALGETAIFAFHDIRNIPSAENAWECSTYNFRTFVDGVVSRGVTCLTMKEWYENL